VNILVALKLLPDVVDVSHNSLVQNVDGDVRRENIVYHSLGGEVGTVVEEVVLDLVFKLQKGFLCEEARWGELKTFDRGNCNC
jgi:hypothetical protein